MYFLINNRCRGVSISAWTKSKMPRTRFSKPRTSPVHNNHCWFSNCSQYSEKREKEDTQYLFKWCSCGSVYMMQPLAICLTCVCRPTPCMVTSNCIPWHLALCWSRMPGLLLVSTALPSMDHEHGTVCQPILEYQIRLCAPSSVISRPTCFSSSLCCCWLVAQ